MSTELEFPEPDQEREPQTEEQRRALSRAAYLLDELTQEANIDAHDQARVLMDQVANKSELDFFPLRSSKIYSADIEENIEQFAQQVSYFDGLGVGGLPGIQEGDTWVAIAVNEIAKDRPVNESAEGATRWGAKVKMTSFGQAFRDTHVALQRFIARRLGAYRFQNLAAAGGIGSTNNMLPIEVHSPTRGARVSYSPSYFINYQVLASPTSPVKGFLHPGRYMFMLTTRGPTNVVDQGMFNVPPDYRIHLNV